MGHAVTALNSQWLHRIFPHAYPCRCNHSVCLDLPRSASINSKTQLPHLPNPRLARHTAPQHPHRAVSALDKASWQCWQRMHASTHDNETPTSFAPLPACAYTHSASTATRAGGRMLLKNTLAFCLAALHTNLRRCKELRTQCRHPLLSCHRSLPARAPGCSSSAHACTRKSPLRCPDLCAVLSSLPPSSSSKTASACEGSKCRMPITAIREVAPYKSLPDCRGTPDAPPPSPPRPPPGTSPVLGESCHPQPSGV